MIKFQHSFTDGGGMLNALTFMNKPEHLPQEFKSARGIPLYMKLLASLLFPLRLLISVKELIPIKWEKRGLINTPTHDNSGVSKFSMSKYYNFDELRVCYKKFDNITFNNYM